jgi:hypothetical protein
VWYMCLLFLAKKAAMWKNCIQPTSHPFISFSLSVPFRFYYFRQRRKAQFT